MKNLLVTISMLCFVFGNMTTKAQSELPYSAEEILEKCIRFHDPEGKWESYSGAVKLINSQPNGYTSGTELIEINVAEDYYKDNWTRGNIKIVKEFKDGKIQCLVNGKNPTNEQVKDFWLSSENIERMKTWHYYHFGHLMHFKNTGAVLQKAVGEEDFRGIPCYTISFICNKENMSLPFWEGNWKFMIDKQSFALRGAHTNALMPEGRTDVYEGVIEIKGIKLPRVVTYYRETDNELLYVDFFAPADDHYNLPPKYQIVNQLAGNHIGLKSTHLLKLDNEEILLKLKQPILEMNKLLADMGYPECGYTVYKVNDDYESEYTHIMEGCWLSKEVYAITHQDLRFKEVFEKYRDLFVAATQNQEYMRLEKLMAEL